MKRTYQTRINLANDQADLLDRFAELSGKVERTLYAQTIAQGKLPESVKNAYLKRFNITSRQFNAVCRPLKGKVKSITELRKNQIDELKQKIKKAESVIKKLSSKRYFTYRKSTKASEPKLNFKLHQKKRRLTFLNHKLERVQAKHKAGKVSLCFGSKKLFNAQHHLEANGYPSHSEWLAQWQSDRNNDFYVLGSKDESAGCQGCVLTLDAHEQASLRLRLPNTLATGKDKYINIPIDLNYGKAAILHALANSTAISYRFKRDTKGWRVFLTTDAPLVTLVTNQCLGSIGVDINVAHLAVAEIDHFGNYLDAISISLNTYGKSTQQAKAVIGDAVKQLMDFAEYKQKPIVIEKLAFSKKKAELETTCKNKYQKRYARMLSSLAYNQIKEVIKSRGFDNGIEVLEVNPAYTSVIGFWKFATRYGISSHQAAALVIARRLNLLPNRRDYGTTQLPVRKVGVHVWSYWRKVARKPRKLAVLHSLRNKAQSSLAPQAALT